jgi:putative addiction module killer protein
MCYHCGVVELLEYVNAAGISPFARWRERLDPNTRARVTVAVFRMEAGNFSAAKGVGSGVFELRMDFGPSYRVYFGKDGDRLVYSAGRWNEEETAGRHRVSAAALAGISAEKAKKE